MEKNYTYPHVNITTRALKHSNAVAEAPDTTVLFVPLYTEKGPTNEIRRVHTLGEFIEIYGELSYENNGQTALNVYNWLSNGGTIYAFRLTYESDNVILHYAGDEHKKVGVTKYPGKYYTNYKIKLTRTNVLKEENNPIVNLEVFNNKTKKNVEVIYNKDLTKINSYLSASEFIRYLTVDPTEEEKVAGKDAYLVETVKKLNKGDSIEFAIEVGEPDTTIKTQNTLIQEFWTGEVAKELLENHLETPIDLIMDAGYSDEIKNAMVNFISGENAVRNDIIGIFDSYKSFNKLENPVPSAATFNNASNIAVYEQYMLIEDATFTNQEIFVSPTYFLSKLIPENDSIYGIQFPTAGLRRGILEDAKQLLGTKPTADKKQEWFEVRINYAEATPREIAFMNQRTHDGSTEDDYTALSFLNNSRCVEKMKKDIERLGRNYLFEFNDSITLAQMSSVLNKYISEWVSNRTLSYALIEVSQNPYSDEAVDVVMNIKFTGTIEIISVDITIQ